MSVIPSYTFSTMSNYYESRTFLSVNTLYCFYFFFLKRPHNSARRLLSSLTNNETESQKFKNCSKLQVQYTEESEIMSNSSSTNEKGNLLLKSPEVKKKKLEFSLDPAESF